MEIEIGRGKKARRAYGFDDIAIVPSRRTRDAEDVDIGWKLGPYLLELPLLASAMDGVVSPATAIELGRLGGLGRAQPRGHLDALRRTPTRSSRRSRSSPREARRGACRRSTRSRVKPELIAQRIREIKDAGVLAAASLTPQRVRDALRGGARGRARHPRHPGHGRLGRARLLGRSSRSTSRSSSPSRRRPGDRRRLRELPDRAAPHAHGRGRRARRRRARRGLHDARRARRRRAAGHGDRRRGGGPRPAPARDRPATAT